MILQILTVLFISGVLAISYGSCDTNNYIYANFDIKTYLSVVPSTILQYGSAVPVTVSGSITVIDGCRVTISHVYVSSLFQTYRLLALPQHYGMAVLLDCQSLFYCQTRL
jgi:hypothetical protein